MTIGEKIRELRKKKHMTQQELAEKTNITCATIINIEKDYNKPSASSLYKICEVLECNYDKLSELL